MPLFFKCRNIKEEQNFLYRDNTVTLSLKKTFIFMPLVSVSFLGYSPLLGSGLRAM